MKIFAFPIVAVLAISGPVFGQTLGGASAGVELSIGVKGADRQPNVAFVVVQPDGGKSTATAIAPYDGERPGTASYPTDFTNAGKHAGKYTWQARAGGKLLASGTFFYKPSKAGFVVFTPH